MSKRRPAFLCHSAEVIGSDLVLHARPRGRRASVSIRPVFCPDCRRHYTTVKPAGVKWTPALRHVRCANCVADQAIANLGGRSCRTR